MTTEIMLKKYIYIYFCVTSYSFMEKTDNNVEEKYINYEIGIIKI